jgi:hypothetical protein
MSKDKRSNYRVPLAVVLGLTLLSGIVHGVLDGRWSQPTDLIAVGSLLGDVPDRVGDWKLVEDRELQPNAASLLRCYGSIVRVYRNEQSGATVNVAVLYGPRGPIAVHTPEVCYSSVGTEQVGPTRREEILVGSERHRFWEVQFSRDGDPKPSLNVWYSWSDGGNWKDSDYPRIWLTENLYKIQVAGPLGMDGQRPVAEFLEVFLAQLQPHIR